MICNKKGGSSVEFPSLHRKPPYLSRAQGTLHDVCILSDPLVVLEKPLQSRLVGMELWFEFGLRQKPAFPPEEGLGKTGAVEVKRDPCARSGHAKTERR